MRHRMLPAAVLLTVTLLLGPAVAHADPGSGEGSIDTSSTGAPVLVTGTGTPKPPTVVVVDAYGTSPGRIVVGQPFDLTLTLYNATSRRADNVVVSLGDTAAGATQAAGITVLGTGNAKFVGTLKGLLAESVTFQAIVSPGTAPGALTVPVLVSFEHEGVRQQVAYTIGLLAERDAALSLVTAELPESVMTGETFDASFEIGNASGFALSGVTLSVEASGAAVTDAALFLGTLDAASTESIDVAITPEAPGPLEVAVVVTYRDDYGRPQVFREVRTVTVEDVVAPGPDEAEEPDEAADENWFVSFFKALFGLGS